MELSLQQNSNIFTSSANGFAIIEIFQKAGKLHVNTNINGLKKNNQIEIFKCNKGTFFMTDLIYMWLLNSVKKIFFSMPLNHIKFVCDEGIQMRFSDIIEDATVLLNMTNSKILQYQDQFKANALEKRNLLFLNASHSARFDAIAKSSLINSETEFFFRNLDLGFSPVTRQWEEAKQQLSLDEFIEYVIQNKIGQVVLLNLYFLRSCIETYKVYLPAMLAKFGIIYNVIDIDNYDYGQWGYLEKKFLHSNHFQRYTTCSPNEIWDGLLNIKTNYIAVPNLHQKDIYHYSFIKNNIKTIRIISHCRMNNVINDMPSILLILEELSQVKAFDLNQAFQIWYLALRNLILAGSHVPLFKKIVYNRALYQLAYHMSNFIKYIFINFIDRDLIGENIKVEIYGDELWEQLFPQYYQKKYLCESKKNQLLDQNNGINLLLSWSPYGISTANGQFSDLISSNKLLLCLSTPVLVPELSSLRNIMCCNKEDLNQKIRNFETIYNDRELLKTLEYTKTIFGKNTEEVAASLIKQQPIDSSKSEYSQLREKERIVHTQIINEFTEQHFKLLQHSFDILFTNKSNTFQLEDSQFFHLPFVQALLKHL